MREGAREELNVDVVGVEVDKSSHFLLALRLLWEGAFKTVSFLTVFLRLALGNDIIVMLKKVPERIAPRPGEGGVQRLKRDKRLLLRRPLESENTMLCGKQQASDLSSIHAFRFVLPLAYRYLNT